MQAKETRLQEIIEGTKQYVIPLFQRAYSWTNKEWKVLWKDIEELCEKEKPRTHFFGSIVSMPTTSVPEGVAKYLLIDGQQRMTTLFVLLALIRDKAAEQGNEELANEIHNMLLVNSYKKGDDYYKLFPTQVDRPQYKNIINHDEITDGQIKEAYLYFEKQLGKTEFTLEKIKNIITEHFSVVSIVLEADDNPYLVFESLNAKGRPLSQADLIKNFFFMRVHRDNQDGIYETLWKPMQEWLGDDLSEFIRHFMMREGGNILKTEVYYELKERVTPENAIEYLKTLHQYSRYYHRMKQPSAEENKPLQRLFTRLNKMEATTAYPIILYFYGEYDKKHISLDDFVQLLAALENFLVRRFVCDYKTNQLNKIFASAYAFVTSYELGTQVEAFKEFLAMKGYPKNSEFSKCFQEAKLYGPAGRQQKTKFLLVSLEESFHHKEIVDVDKLTIEHIMPQTLSEWWQDYLGEDWMNTHEKWLHTIGNLTLTAYNSELSNDDFLSKRQILSNSHLELNKPFETITEWKLDNIKNRAELLSQKALEIWPSISSGEDTQSASADVTHTTPSRLEFFDETFEVESWREVFEHTLNVIGVLLPEKFSEISERMPSFVNKDKSRFRAFRLLSNGYYIETNQSAVSLYRKCLQALQICGLSAKDWKVDYQ